jgi:hypothetical protein
MADLLLRVNGRDLTTYMRMAHEDGFDPSGGEDLLEHVYAGAGALREGQSYVSDVVSNRPWNVPLILEAATTDALHALIRDINADLVRGAMVEFRAKNTTDISNFTLERGILRPQYEHWLVAASKVRAVLTLTTTPFARTSAPRLVASLPPGVGGTPLATQSLVHFPATGILGDRQALTNIEVRVGSQIASSGRMVAIGVHPHPSFNPQFHASDGRMEAQASSVVAAASGAIASKVIGIPISPTGASGVAARFYLTPPDAHIGRHRVLGVMRSGLDQPVTLYARDRFGAPLGPTVAASQLDQNRLGMIDLGEVNVPARASGQEGVPTQFIELIGGGASGAQIVASRGLQFNSITLIPLDVSPGLMMTKGGLKSLLYGDSFKRFAAATTVPLSSLPEADQGGIWTRQAPGIDGYYGAGGAVPSYIGERMTVTDSNGIAANGKIGLHALASGANLSDTLSLVSIQALGVPSIAASGAEFCFYPKANERVAFADARPAGIEVRLNLTPASMALSLWSRTAAGATVLHASAGMATVLASGVYGGQRHTLSVRSLGNLVDVWLATGPVPASPILSATHANLTMPGAPHVRLLAGQNVASGLIAFDDVRVYSVASAPDTDPREYFRFDSFPEPRAIQANASIFKADRAADFRGVLPRIPAVGSPGASGPARIVVFSGEPENFSGVDVMDVSVSVVERWEYLR